MLGKRLPKSSCELEEPGPGISKVPSGGYATKPEPSQSRQSLRLNVAFTNSMQASSAGTQSSMPQSGDQPPAAL